MAGPPVVEIVLCVHVPVVPGPGQTVTTTVEATSLMVPVRLSAPVVGELGMGLTVPEDEGLGPGGTGESGEDGPGETGRPDEEAPVVGRIVPLVGGTGAGVVVVSQGTVRVTVAGPPLMPQVSQTVTVAVNPGGM